METLITPQEVIDLAFPGNFTLNTKSIGETTILSAQQKFIRPVLGDLYDRVESGGLPELLDEYIKPPLAHYVKLLLLPVLSASVGSIGIVQPKGSTFTAADAKNLSALRKQARSEAMGLMLRAVQHIEDNPELYPEYNISDNILNRTSITSQIVL